MNASAAGRVVVVKVESDGRLLKTGVDQPPSGGPDLVRINEYLCGASFAPTRHLEVCKLRADAD